jgi:hypothetical protein
LLPGAKRPTPAMSDAPLLPAGGRGSTERRPAADHLDEFDGVLKGSNPSACYAEAMALVFAAVVFVGLAAPGFLGTAALM